MTAPRRARRPAAGGFTLAHAAADHWGIAAKACLGGVTAAAAGANVGFLYATEALGDDLSSILTFMRETTRIPHWTGAVAPGLCADADEYRGGGALAVMVGRLPEAGFHCFSGLNAASIREIADPWLAGRRAAAIVHGDPRNPAVPQAIEDLADGIAVMAGGLVSAAGPPAQVADTVVSGGLSGLLLGPEIEVVTGLTQGCTPIGPAHMVSEAWQGVLMGLDGRPALEVLKEEAGELIARDIRRAAGYIHVAVPVPGSDPHDYLVRGLVGIDARQGWLALGGRAETGDRLMFVRRDPNAARADLKRMLADVRRRLDGRPVLAAFYFTCVARGADMFGEDGIEAAMVRKALGGAPLLGFFANGEIAGGRLYGYTGVLMAIVGAPP